MNGPRVAVIGGGAAGLSTAMYLGELGVTDVVVLEAGHPADGSSGLSAGIFNRQINDPLKLRLRAYSVAQLERFADEDGFSLVRNGYVRVARTAEQLEDYREVRALQAEMGIAGELLDQDGLARLVPGMRVDDFVGGLYGAHDGHLDGHELCDVYKTRAQAHGVRVRVRTPVTAAEDVGSRIRLVSGTDELGLFDVVVNAAGPRATSVGAMLGVDSPLVNERHQICVVEFEDRPERRIPAVQTYVPGWGSEALWVRLERPGSMLAGLHTHDVRSAGAGEDPETFKRTVDDSYAEAVGEEILSRFEEWDDLRFSGGWAGLYPVSPDGQFQVGPHRDRPQVVSVTGLGGVGLTNSAAVGRIAAEWIATGESTTFDFADQLLPDRASLAVTSGAGA